MISHESDPNSFSCHHNERRLEAEVDVTDACILLPHLPIITRNVTFDDEFENAPIVAIHVAPDRKREQTDDQQQGNAKKFGHERMSVREDRSS